MDVADSGFRLLSDRKPKKEDETMPGVLKSVMSRVEDVAERDATECA